IHRIVLGKDADEWVVATEGGTGGLWRAEVDQNLRVATLQQARDGRLGRHARVDLAVLDGCDERITGTDRNEACVGSLVAGLAEKRQGDRVRSRADVGDPQLFPLEVRGRLDGVRLPGRDHLRLTRRDAELADGL